MKKVIAVATIVLIAGCTNSGSQMILQNGVGAVAGAAGSGKGVPDSLKPNDEYFGQQWALHNDGSQEVGVQMDDLHTTKQAGKKGVDIGWLEARADIERLAKNPVTVAVIDYGVDATHPDLQGRIADGGWDFITDAALTGDPDGHGTNVTGIIVANGNNKMGISGVTPPSVKVLPLNVLSSDFSNFLLNGQTLADYVTKAINYAVDHKASIINMSLGWPKIIDSDASRAAIDNAVKKGVLVVVSAGNNRKDHPTYPCSHLGVLCVGAISNTGEMSFYSNYGGAVDVLAPGDEILSTYPTTSDSENFGVQNYEELTGTSQATPFVTSIAAILKSIDPKVTPNELMARILQSTSAPPTPGAAQYGLVNVGRAMSATPLPTYSPNFKTLEESVSLDEATLTAKGTIDLRNLWAPATQVQIDVTVNNAAAGTLTLPTMNGEGATVQIPWSYKFKSLDESAIVHLVLKISDSSGTAKSFESNVTVSRVATSVAGQKILPIDPTIAAADLITTAANNRVYSRLLSVGTMGANAYIDDSNGPNYYKVTQNADKSISIQIFDGHHLEHPTTIAVPFIARLLHVMRVDMRNNGEMDWVVIGSGHTKDKVPAAMVQFYFLGPDLKPLFGNASAWQALPENPTQAGAFISENYEDMNSWIRTDEGLLVPTLLFQDVLPKLDNFSSLDSRATDKLNHAVYMAPPKDWQSTKADSAVVLELHAVDNRAFRQDHDKLFIVNALPQTRADMKAGHLRYVLSDDQVMSAHIYMLDVTDTKHAVLSPLPKWDYFSSLGTAIIAKPGTGAGVSVAYTKFYDEKTGGIAWAQSNETLEALTEYTYVAKGYPDPIKGFISAYDGPQFGHMWFLDSNFSLIVRGTLPNGKAISSTFPLERETSNISENQMQELFSPFMIGTKAALQPALFIDSTPLRGNLISLVTWNSKTLSLEKTLRYSLQVPSNCLNMSPVYMTGDVSSFAIPLLCSEKEKAFLHILHPQP